MSQLGFYLKDAKNKMLKEANKILTENAAFNKLGKKRLPELYDFVEFPLHRLEERLYNLDREFYIDFFKNNIANMPHLFKKYTELHYKQFLYTNEERFWCFGFYNLYKGWAILYGKAQVE